MQRLQELRTLVTSAFVQLAITEREQRLIALQERWDGLRQARAALAAGDYAAAMRTGLVCRKLRTVGGAKNARVVEEYEINTALIEALNSVERRAAIETGQEQENVNLTGQISSKSIALSKVMSIQELEALEKKMLAAMEAERQGKAIAPGQGADGDESRNESKSRFGQHQRFVPSTLKKFSLTRQGLSGAVTRLDSYRGSLFLPERSHARNAYEELALLN